MHIENGRALIAEIARGSAGIVVTGTSLSRVDGEAGKLIIGGFPLQELATDLFTPVFTIWRLGGWTAHVLEQIDEDRLIRPRADIRGELGRKWVPIEE
jgi:citrate synthase